MTGRRFVLLFSTSFSVLLSYHCKVINNPKFLHTKKICVGDVQVTFFLGVYTFSSFLMTCQRNWLLKSILKPHTFYLHDNFFMTIGVDLSAIFQLNFLNYGPVLWALVIASFCILKKNVQVMCSTC